MLVIYNGKTVNLDNFEAISYRESLINDGYPVEATRQGMSGGLFGGTNTITEELVRMTYKAGASMLVKDITAAWANGDKVFDINKWTGKDKELSNDDLKKSLKMACDQIAKDGQCPVAMGIDKEVCENCNEDACTSEVISSRWVDYFIQQVQQAKNEEERLEMNENVLIAEDSDDFVCKCGNTSASSGFAPCDETGKRIEPTAENHWDGLYVCEDCGQIIRFK